MITDAQITLKELYTEGWFWLRKLGYKTKQDNNDKFIIYSAWDHFIHGDSHLIPLAQSDWFSIEL